MLFETHLDPNTWRMLSFQPYQYAYSFLSHGLDDSQCDNLVVKHVEQSFRKISSVEFYHCICKKMQVEHFPISNEEISLDLNLWCSRLHKNVLEKNSSRKKIYNERI